MEGGTGGIGMGNSSSLTGVPAKTVYGVGELIASPRNTYPILLEVIQLEADGWLRVRGLDWPAGFTAVLPRDEVRYVTSILSMN
jgi:hypothetical protein